jgi:hypothetical protein
VYEGSGCGVWEVGLDLEGLEWSGKVMDAIFGRRTGIMGFGKEKRERLGEIKYLHLKLRVMRIMKWHSEKCS